MGNKILPTKVNSLAIKQIKTKTNKMKTYKIHTYISITKRLNKLLKMMRKTDINLMVTISVPLKDTALKQFKTSNYFAKSQMEEI